MLRARLDVDGDRLDADRAAEPGSYPDPAHQGRARYAADVDGGDRRAAAELDPRSRRHGARRLVRRAGPANCCWSSTTW